MQTGCEDFEVAALVVSTAGIVLRGTGLLEIHARSAPNLAPEHILALNADATLPVPDLEVWLPVPVEPHYARNPGHGTKKSIQVMLGNSATNGRHETEPTAKQGHQFVCVQTKLHKQRVRNIGRTVQICSDRLEQMAWVLSGFKLVAYAIGKTQALTWIHSSGDSLKQRIRDEVLGAKGNKNLCSQILAGVDPPPA
jgi:hypothetical protein